MTAIEWTDRTWNPVVGCTKVSAGCKNCYAKTEWDRRHKGHLAGKKVAPQYAQPFEVVQLKPERLSAPLGWRKPAMVFVNSVSDLFHEDVPFDYIDRVFAVMALTPQHTYQVLTKRPERMREWAEQEFVGPRVMAAQAEFARAHVPFPWPLPNVWLGTSVEDQAAADARIPELLATPAAVRFLSCEPLLGPVNLVSGLMLGNVLQPGPTGIRGDGTGGDPPIDWVIVGGESGPSARPTNVEHIRSVVQQCLIAGAPVFVKQLGAVLAGDFRDFPEGSIPCRPDGFGHLKDRKGGNPEEWAEELRVGQFPEVRRAS